MDAVVVFDRVSKKFRRGERHDSLRDMIPALVRSVFTRAPASALGDREFWALRDVSFQVRPGEALGIVGPNGAGKSTTLKLLTRILRPTSGQCWVRGRVGALIEVAAGFHPELTGRENVFLQGAIMGMKRAEIARRFDEIVEFAGVAEFIDTPVKRYSSGMNARLGFSIAAHLEPAVLVIDEVLSVGDMAFQQRCFDRMLGFKRQGIAVVLVSHNLQAVSTLCDHAVFISREVRSAGPTVDVIDAYVRTSHQARPPSEIASIAEIASAFFVGDGQPTGVSVDVVPGSQLTLRVLANARAALDDVTIGFVLTRSTDQLVVFHGNIHRRDLGEPEDFCGRFSLDFNFSAHLLRGHYYVSVHILHNPTQTFLLSQQQVGAFVVREHFSRTGIADVSLTATLAPTGEVVAAR